MDIIKEYVDSLIRQKEVFLEYKRVHNEWKTHDTEQTQRNLNRVKELLRNSNENATKLWQMLKEQNIPTGGRSQFMFEMQRYEKWLAEYFV